RNCELCSPSALPSMIQPYAISRTIVPRRCFHPDSGRTPPLGLAHQSSSGCKLTVCPPIMRLGELQGFAPAKGTASRQLTPKAQPKRLENFIRLAKTRFRKSSGHAAPALDHALPHAEPCPAT